MPDQIEIADYCSPAYRLNTANAESSRAVNLFLETIEQGPRKGRMRYRSIPGMKNPAFANLGGDPMRALLEIDGGNRLFAVMGDRVFEVFADGSATALTGTIALNSHPVTMVSNGFQLALASGGLGYIVEGGTPGTVTPITFTDGTPLRAATMTFLDNYFIANMVDSKQVFISNLAPDGAIWDAGDTAIKEGYADNIATVFADNEQLWLFGNDQSAEVWTNTGATFPFERIQGAVLKFPTTAPYSVAGVLGHRAWLQNNVVYAAYGLNPERISDYGVEEAIKSYGNTSDAEAFAYVNGGHIFYVITFPSAPGGGKTWVYDASVKAWHERGKWTNGRFERYHGRVYAKAFGKDLVGDPQTGKIWEVDPLTYTDSDGGELRRLHAAPYITMQMDNIRYSQLTIDCDTGVGLDVSPEDPGYDPQVVMRWSANRGKNFSNERMTTLGRVGQNDIRVIFNQLGSSRIGMTFETYVTDPVDWTFQTAYLRFSKPLEGR